MIEYHGLRSFQMESHVLLFVALVFDSGHQQRRSTQQNRPGND